MNVPNILIQELINFRQCLERFKTMDDEFEQIYDTGEEPNSDQAREFAKLKNEYDEFKEFFNKFEYNYEGQWTPESLAEELINQIFG